MKELIQQIKDMGTLGRLEESRSVTGFGEKLVMFYNFDMLNLVVYSLIRPRLDVIDHYTYGKVMDGTCAGCAACALIMEVGDYNLEEFKWHCASRIYDIRWRYLNREALTDWAGIDSFESAINSLRAGDVCGYNYYVMKSGVEEGRDFSSLALGIPDNAWYIDNDVANITSRYETILGYAKDIFDEGLYS